MALSCGQLLPEVFYLADGRGNFFCLTLCVYAQNIQNLWRIQKWMKTTEKDIDPDPTSGSDFR